MWYGSSRERSAWAELVRHTTTPELSPFQLRRRVGRVDKIVSEHSRVQVPPVTLLDLLPGILPIGEQITAIRALFDRLVREGRDAIRRPKR